MDPTETTMLFETATIPVGDYVNDAVRWIGANYKQAFRDAKRPVAAVLKAFEGGLRGAPPTFVILALSLIAWQFAGTRIALVTLFGLLLVGFIGAWQAAMTSLAILVTAVLICCLIGIPLGILAARSDRLAAMLRPVLDLMQTIPSFVYLVPIVVLFGIGNVPGVIVTAIYASPPLIRLTNLGIREVRQDCVEAANAFGSSPMQMLLKVELPLARPAIMAGLNQTVMLSLAMSVVASMISVAGLGRIVLTGIQQLDLSRAAVGGIAIVVMAVLVDRITQSFGYTRRERGGKRLSEVGPIGLVRRLLKRVVPEKPGRPEAASGPAGD